MQTTQNNYNYGKKFRKYTYSSIPISFCILALLLLNSGIGNQAHAVNTDHETTSNNTPPISYPKDNPTALTHAENIVDMVDMGGTDNVDNTNYTISRAVSPSTSLTITTPNLSTIAPVGEVSYLSSNVTYSANDISSYSMKISYAEGNSSLSNSNITDSSGNTTTITGAGGKTPASMSSNTWGYALADTNANNTTLTYNTMPAYGSGTTIVSGNAESVPTTTKKLVFASKFAENATSGHYRTQVLLSLTATPKVVAGLDSITYMQEMTGEVCKQTPQKLKDQTIPTGGSKVLIDKRDNSTYTVARLEDGNCWMTQNLRLTTQSLAAAGHSNTLTSVDTDVDSFTMPTTLVGSGSSVSRWTNSSIKPYSATFNNATNGTYYNWSVAVAEADTSSLKNNVDAPWSVCPKGWKLPPSTGDGSYSQFMSAAGIGTDKTGVTKIQSAPYNFPMAGHVYSGRLDHNGTWGVYWTRTADSTITEWAGYLYFTSSKIGRVASENDSWRRSNGYPIRCVAIGS